MKEFSRDGHGPNTAPRNIELGEAKTEGLRAADAVEKPGGAKKRKTTLPDIEEVMDSRPTTSYRSDFRNFNVQNFQQWAPGNCPIYYDCYCRFRLD